VAIAAHSDVSDLLADIHAHLTRLLSENLVGIYVFGSVASDSYDPGVSDLDLLVVTARELVAADYSGLWQMHTALAAGREQWKDRIEVAYLSRRALRTFKERTSEMGIVSPGEPFHVVNAGRDWLMNWYDVREHAIVVAGPDPKALIDPITRSELKACIRDYVRLFPERVRDNFHQGSDAYAVLTMCRSLHTRVIGETATKRVAAEWAASRYPEWSNLISQAQEWRLAADNLATSSVEAHAQVKAFVDFTVAVWDAPGL
jgi:predicted nucleotidyltransferase